eukprot:CAMPEP_0113501366 /NCGR_PEP_ID=MMETSP0014_2-20120614/32913_1 /TAXON_ID=2857 /ORGANISM="Nitzschia sp." /LENGTH=238 /DNA_ID=CAMNT_0000395943 /DNA_START=1 /DNA_END=713 /DNA_ORIENTATION=- /assembly_acc=CAM_ASM_000159
MEELVLAVGGISGRVGSKFDRKIQRRRQRNSNNNNNNNNKIGMSSPPPPRTTTTTPAAPAPAPSTASPATAPLVPSKRQQKKRRLEEFSTFGIPGLHSVPFGCGEEEGEKILNGDLVDEDSTTATSSDPTNSNRANNNFCIKGTVAHILCRIDTILQQQHDNDNSHTATSIDIDVIDDDHYLVSATIVDAYVRKDYFDVETNQFCSRGHRTSHNHRTGPTTTTTTNTTDPQPPPPFLT